MKLLFNISLLFLAVAGVLVPVHAQQIWVEPEFPISEGSATVYFDAKQCECPLENYSGAIYAHTGILKDNSVWQNVIGSWGDNTLQPQLRPVSDKVYALDINPSIAQFYNESRPVEITKMAFVFRSSDGSQQTADLFVDVFQPGLTNIVSPKADQIFSPDDTVYVEAVALGADSLYLSLNGDEMYFVEGGVLNHKIVPDADGENSLEIRTVFNGTSYVQTRTFFIRKENRIAPIPSEFRHYGVNLLPDENAALFVLPAPGKKFIYLTGDFNDWGVDEDLQMNVSIDQKTFWLRIDGLDPKEEYAYQYIIDGDLKLADPYARKVLDPNNDPSIPEDIYPDLKEYPYSSTSDLVSSFQLEDEPYEWKTVGYEPPGSGDLQIYELLIRDFVEDHSYRSVIDSLDYLESIGINAIELMPVMEFEGNSSWGYNTSFHFALDKYYGTSNDFKEFVDACHSRGIAVILDIVINHAYGQNPLVRMYWDTEKSRPAADNPWFNEVSPNQVFSFGYDFNHESTYTVDYFNEVLTYWLEEFRVDGYRLDFTKGLTNRPGDGGFYDASRIRILKDYADHLWNEFPEAYVILEHFAPPNEEQELAEHGMLVWGNHNHNFNQIAMGYQSGSDFSWSSYQDRGMDEPMVVSYMESHDEERMLYKTRTWGNQSGEYDIKELETGLERAKMASAFWLTVPGPKLMWMFGELGYDISIDDPCRVCEKPIRWNYLTDAGRNSLKMHYADLFKLRLDQDVFRTEDFSINSSSYIKWVYLRGDENQVLTIGNIDVNKQSVSIPVQGDARWTDFFTGKVFTSRNGAIEADLEPGEYLLLSAVPFREVESQDSEITISSNLNTGQLTVSSLLPLQGVWVYDMAGREIYAKENIGSSAFLVDLTSNWYAGHLVILCQDESGHKKSFRWVVTP